jgi:hypothetical protein
VISFGSSTPQVQKTRPHALEVDQEAQKAHEAQDEAPRGRTVKTKQFRFSRR